MFVQEKKGSHSLWNMVKIALAFGLAGFIISRTNLGELFSLYHRIDLAWLVIGVLFFFLTTLLKALQYYFLINRRVGYPQVLNIVVVQNAVSNFIATSAGIASYLTLFRVEQGVKVSRAALVFLLTKVGDLISIWLFMLVSSALLWSRFTGLHELILLSLALIGAAISLFFLVVILRQRFVSALTWGLGKVKLSHMGFINKLMDFLSSLAEQSHAFVFRMVGIGVAFSLVYLAVTMAWLYASLLTFSFDVGVLPVVFVNTFMQLISYLPIQVFGGLGVFETTSLYLYGLFDVSQTELAAVLIGMRVLFYLTNLFALLYLPLYSFFFNRPSKTKT
jgi:uncharacterized membrane protein YbhN (UPF0104 family)